VGPWRGNGEYFVVKNALSGGVEVDRREDLHRGAWRLSSGWFTDPATQKTYASSVFTFGRCRTRPAQETANQSDSTRRGRLALAIDLITPARRLVWRHRHPTRRAGAASPAPASNTIALPE